MANMANEMIKKLWCERFFASEDDVKKLKDTDDLAKYFADIREDVLVKDGSRPSVYDTSIWNGLEEPMTADIGIVPVSKYPLLAPFDAQAPKFKRNGYEISLPPIDLEDPRNRRCAEEGTGWFVSTVLKRKLQTVPTLTMAKNSILRRAGLDCPTFNRDENSRYFRALESKRRAELITECLGLCSKRAKVVIRYGEVFAVRSEEFVPMAEEDVYNTVLKTIRADHPDAAFREGVVSLPYGILSIALNDPLQEEGFRARLAGMKSPMKCDSLMAGVTLSMSNVGQAAITVSCFYEADGRRIRLGTAVRMTHDAGASLDDLADRCSKLGAQFKDAEEKIERLGAMDVEHVGDAIRAVAKRYNLPAAAEEVAAECDAQFPTGGSGLDCYLALCDIADRQAASGKMSADRQADLGEKVAALMDLPFDRYGQDGTWEAVD